MIQPIPLRPDYGDARRLESCAWSCAIAHSALANLRRSDPAKVLKAARPNDFGLRFARRAQSNRNESDRLPGEFR
jgi:hypothetical protein